MDAVLRYLNEVLLFAKCAFPHSLLQKKKVYFPCNMWQSIFMLQNSSTALAKLFYENYGMSVTDIATALDMSATIVRSIVEEFGLVRSCKEEENTELAKQRALEPFYAQAEAAILCKINEVASSLEANQADATQRISACARAFKDLKSQYTLDKVDAKGAGVAVQILNKL